MESIDRERHTGGCGVSLGVFRDDVFKRFLNDIDPILVNEKTDDDVDDAGPADCKVGEIDK
jgi:hypothetical protein